MNLQQSRYQLSAFTITLPYYNKRDKEEPGTQGAGSGQSSIRKRMASPVAGVTAPCWRMNSSSPLRKQRRHTIRPVPDTSTR
jgi:hypothetical protein